MLKIFAILFLALSLLSFKNAYAVKYNIFKFGYSRIESGSNSGNGGYVKYLVSFGKHSPYYWNVSFNDYVINYSNFNDSNVNVYNAHLGIGRYFRVNRSDIVSVFGSVGYSYYGGLDFAPIDLGLRNNYMFDKHFSFQIGGNGIFAPFSHGIGNSDVTGYKLNASLQYKIHKGIFLSLCYFYKQFIVNNTNFNNYGLQNNFSYSGVNVGLGFYF